MKRIYFLILLLSVGMMSSCGSKPASKTKEVNKIKQDAGTFLDNWHLAATNADFEAYFNAMAADGYYIGTDAGEVWTKAEFAAFSKPFFDKGRAWDFKKIDRHISVDDGQQIIWFNETLTTWMGVCRGSGVIKRNSETGTYQIKEYVLSLTVPNDKMRDVIKVIEN